ncbi:hypothetical protein [Methanosarcina sp. MSH10X1]|nr:hypothetical protein [Methanosarcina sp. MSH10X1]
MVLYVVNGDQRASTEDSEKIRENSKRDKIIATKVQSGKMKIEDKIN